MYLYIYYIDQHLACAWKESRTTFSLKSSHNVLDHRFDIAKRAMSKRTKISSEKTFRDVRKKNLVPVTFLIFSNHAT